MVSQSKTYVINCSMQLLSNSLQKLLILSKIPSPHNFKEVGGGYLRQKILKVFEGGLGEIFLQKVSLSIIEV